MMIMGFTLKSLSTHRIKFENLKTQLRTNSCNNRLSLSTEEVVLFCPNTSFTLTQLLVTGRSLSLIE